jgi:hypothetical protein
MHVSEWVEKGTMLSFRLHGTIPMANALRRALLQDVESWAPDHVVFRKNTSCQPDEYIAHRIGMIPFRQASTVEGRPTLDLCVSDRDAMTTDISGDYRAVNDQEIMCMIPGQELDCTITMRRDSGRTHSRFCSVAGVGYEISPTADSVVFTFETINGEAPGTVLLAAIERLMARIDRCVKRCVD